MRITALAGGVGGARFIRGLRAHLDRSPALADSHVTVIGNTGDDTEIWGLHISPDLDTVCYTLAGLIDERKGWGLRDETFAAYVEHRRCNRINAGDQHPARARKPSFANMGELQSEIITGLQR